MCCVYCTRLHGLSTALEGRSKFIHFPRILLQTVPAGISARLIDSRLCTVTVKSAAPQSEQGAFQDMD